jgi:hypothetical protein
VDTSGSWLRPAPSPRVISARGGVLNGLIDHEVQQRTRALEKAIRDLDAQIGRWPSDLAYTVAETSVYVDRTLAAQGLAGAPVTLLTLDTSQAARARHAGLAFSKLATPVGEEEAAA